MLSRISRKIRATGWRGLPDAAIRSLRFRANRAATRFYRDHVLTSPTVARAFPFRKPPILLLSYPRSGSSWVGKILSLSPDLAYLREPVTQAFLATHEGRALMDPAPEAIAHDWCLPLQGDALADYLGLADKAFAGILPENMESIAKHVSHFAPLQRRNRALVIKEVNPLIGGLFFKRYSPRVVMLLRHPAAIAESFDRMGWLRENYEDFGYWYGMHLAGAIASVGDGGPTTVIYEDLAKAPQEHFRSLFAALEARPPDDLETILGEYCESRRFSDHPYEIRRDSRSEADKWRQQFPPEKIDAVMRGYLRSDLAYYR